jgi:hypothetical protein
MAAIIIPTIGTILTTITLAASTITVIAKTIPRLMIITARAMAATIKPMEHFKPVKLIRKKIIITHYCIRNVTSIQIITIL